MMPRRKKPIVGVVLTFLIAAGTPGAADQVAQSPAPSCDYSCLSKAMADFVNALTSRTPGAIRLSDSAEIRENARVVQLEGAAAGSTVEPSRSGGAGTPLFPQLVDARGRDDGLRHALQPFSQREADHQRVN